MSLVCAISGSPPDDPVISPNGFLFERRLVEKHIDATGRCPVTGMELSKDDLKPIKTDKAAKPRPITAASIPGLLSLFQNEWDSTISEVYTLRNHLDMVRNQLSHSLYQHDAATRVIARLIRERDSAREEINDLQKQISLARSVDGGAVEAGLSESLIEEMQELAKRLLGTRKKRQIDGVAPVDQVKEYKCTGAFSLHSASTPGVLCLDIDKKASSALSPSSLSTSSTDHDDDENRKKSSLSSSSRASGDTPGYIATGGADGTVVYFDLATERTLSRMHGHMKRVNCVKNHPIDDVIISGSDDKTIRIWKCDTEANQYKCAHTIRRHKGGVQALSIHPLNEYFVSCAKDKSWIFFDLNSGRCLKNCGDLPCHYRCISVHPDGMIVGGGGEDGKIHIWDLKGALFRASLEGHTEAITSMDFSENGYYLVTGSLDGTTRMWDLRKSLTFQTIQSDDGKKNPVNSVTFDHSGQFVAQAANSVSVHHFESRANTVPVVTFDDHQAEVTAAQFGPKAKYLVSASKDRIVRLWRGKPSN